ncbi:transposase [Streptomyces sp. NL15-2K]|nr:transposase [Streptomyces sp. NL15-2K]
MQVGVSVREGTVSSVTLLRRLNNHSRKNQIYRVFREVGRAVRTIVLLRYLSDPQLREQITRATNKAEAYNGYTKWLHFGGDGYLRSRDPELQEKAVKFLDLMANSIIRRAQPAPQGQRAPLRRLRHRHPPHPARPVRQRALPSCGWSLTALEERTGHTSATLRRIGGVVLYVTARSHLHSQPRMDGGAAHF